MPGGPSTIEAVRSCSWCGVVVMFLGHGYPGPVFSFWLGLQASRDLMVARRLEACGDCRCRGLHRGAVTPHRWDGTVEEGHDAARCAAWVLGMAPGRVSPALCGRLLLWCGGGLLPVRGSTVLLSTAAGLLPMRAWYSCPRPQASFTGVGPATLVHGQMRMLCVTPTGGEAAAPE